MLGRSESGDSIAAMADDVSLSLSVNLAASHSLNTDHGRIINPRDKLAIESIQTAFCC